MMLIGNPPSALLWVLTEPVHTYGWVHAAHTHRRLTYPSYVTSGLALALAVMSAAKTEQRTRRIST